MILETIALTRQAPHASFYAPFVVSVALRYSTADYWTTIFNAPHEEITELISVVDVVVNGVRLQNSVGIAAVETTENSWWFSGDILYIHPNNTYYSYLQISYGKGYGFTDTSVVYIGGVEYLPYVESAPSPKRQEDIQKYKKLSFLNGSSVLANQLGDLDVMLDTSIIGNSLSVDYVDDSLVVDSIINPTDIINIGKYYVESVERSLDKVSLKLQDNRKINIQVLVEKFSVVDYVYLDQSDSGKYIPLIYGTVRSAPCTPVNATQTGSTTATYRASLLLTSITGVRVKINDTWVGRALDSVDLANGTFTISSARESTTDAPYECVIDCTGIPVEYAPDVIVDLYTRRNDELYNNSYFNVAEWDTERVGIPPIGIVISEQIALPDLVAKIQNSTFPAFRFEYDYYGLKTIRKDNRDREALPIFIDTPDILNNDELSIEENTSLLSATVTVAYNKEWNSGKYNRLTDSTYSDSVRDAYQWTGSTEIETLLSDGGDAQAVLEAKALEYSTPIKVASIDVAGTEYVNLRIYDIILVNLTGSYANGFIGELPERSYSGVYYCQVIGVKPNYKTTVTELTLRILENRQGTNDSFIFMAVGDDIVAFDQDIVMVL